MANDVFANSREIQCKKADGKSICAFPDVCMTPPENPATPPGVPIPYPNTGFAKDTTSGSKKVKISKKEVMLKNKSYFKKSVGDEAGCAAKKGVISSSNRGKVYFKNWSMDVKVEGKNVVRHLDLTTHNHMSEVGNESIPWPEIDSASMAKTAPCKDDKQKQEEACADNERCPGALGVPVDTMKNAISKPGAREGATAAALGDYEHGKGSRSPKQAQLAQDAATPCTEASRCHLQPYSKKQDNGGCCNGQTAHHVPPKSAFLNKGSYGSGSGALCVCLEGSNQYVGSHGKNHAALDYLSLAEFPGAMTSKGTVDSSKVGQLSTKRYIEISAAAVAAQTGCSEKCIHEQLKQSFKNDHKISDSTMVDPYISLKFRNSSGQTAAAYQQSQVGTIITKMKTALSSLAKPTSIAA